MVSAAVTACLGNGGIPGVAALIHGGVGIANLGLYDHRVVHTAEGRDGCRDIAVHHLVDAAVIEVAEGSDACRGVVVGKLFDSCLVLHAGLVHRGCVGSHGSACTVGQANTDRNEGKFDAHGVSPWVKTMNFMVRRRSSVPLHPGYR